MLLFTNSIKTASKSTPDLSQLKKKLSLPGESQMLGARRKRVFFHGKRRKLSFYLRSFQSIFGGRNCSDFWSNRKTSHEIMGSYLPKYWSNEDRIFFPTCTSLSCASQYDFFPLKTLPFFTDFNTNFVLRKISGFSHMIKISAFPDIFLKFLCWRYVP